jgi:hypothetical protein
MGANNGSGMVGGQNSAMTGVLSDQFNFFASNDELQRRIGMTPFVANLREQVMGV